MCTPTVIKTVPSCFSAESIIFCILHHFYVQFLFVKFCSTIKLILDPPLGFTTKYFKLDKGTCQGDLISAYLFILVLEIVFNLIKQNKYIHGLTFFDHTFLYKAYADDTTFFLKDKESVKKGNERLWYLFYVFWFETKQI